MCKLLMSINPEHVENILAGKKKYEFRKKKCKEQIDSIVIYSTAPVMKVVAEVEVKDIIEDTPQIVWKRTSNAAGVDKKFFDKLRNKYNYDDSKKEARKIIINAYKQWLNTLLKDGVNFKSNHMYIDGFNKYINNQEILSIICGDDNLNELLKVLSFFISILSSFKS